MKYVLTVVAAIVLSLLAVHMWGPVGQGDGGTAKETAYERVMRTGVLRCGYAMWPPYMLVKDANSGRLSGVMYDVTEDIASRLNWQVEWVEETDWSSWVEGLKTQRFDAFCAGNWVSAERGSRIIYTQPLFYNAVYAYVRSDDNRFKGYADFNNANVRISSQDGEYSDLVARRDFPLAKQVSLPGLAELTGIFLNVASNKADVVFNEHGLARGYIDANPGQLKKLLDEPYELFPVTLAVGMGEFSLQSSMDSALTEMKNQRALNKIITRYVQDNEIFIPLATPYKARN